MTNQNAPQSDFSFDLGALTRHRRVGNAGLLRDLARTVHGFVGADVTYLAIHEGPISESAADCAAIGPWETDQSERFLDVSRWAAEDRAVALQLEDRTPGTLYKRSELIDEELFRNSKLYREFHEPMSIGDACKAFHESPNGLKVVLAFGAVSTDQPLDEDVLERARLTLPVVFRAFDEGWKPVPAWAQTLRPQALRILQLVIDGHDDEHIAARTGLTYHSVRAHLKRLFRVAEVRSRLHLMQAYLNGTNSEELDRQAERINARRAESNEDSGVAMSAN